MTQVAADLHGHLFVQEAYALAGRRPASPSASEEEPAWNVDLFELERRVNARAIALGLAGEPSGLNVAGRAELITGLFSRAIEEDGRLADAKDAVDELRAAVLDTVERVVAHVAVGRNLPPGWRVAPEQPTGEMLSRGGFYCIGHAGAVNQRDLAQAGNIYRAMIAAIPRAEDGGLQQDAPALPDQMPRPLSEWTEEDGDVLWWRFPLMEPPYIGSPLDLGRSVRVVVDGVDGGPEGVTYQVGGWPGRHTHWTPAPKVIAPPGAEGSK